MQTQSNSIDINSLMSNINTDDLFTCICHYELDVQIQLLSMLYQPYMEPNLINYLEYVFGLSADHKQLEKLIQVTQVVIDKINPVAWEKVFPIVKLGLTSIKFSTKLLGLNVISQFAKTHSKVASQYMPEIIRELISVSSDPKPQVKAQVNLTFVDQVNTIENVDVKHLFPVVISAYTAPAENTQKALDALIATPFVNDVDIPTMGFLVPLLTRSMREKKMVYQRRAAVVIQTLCKLLKNPVYAKPFYPVLEPVLTRGYEEIADPEIRQDPELVKIVMDHIESHLNALQNTDPRLLQIIGQQPIPPLQPPMDPNQMPQDQGGPEQPPVHALQQSPMGAVMDPAVADGKQIKGGDITAPRGESLPKMPTVDGSLLPNQDLQQQALGNVK